MAEIADVIQSISVILACWAVISGIDAWRREFLGKRRIELSEETLEAFFAVRDAIAFIRNPFSSTNEGSTRERGDYESEEETLLLNRAYIVFERYQTKKDVISRFATLKYRFMAAFGKETESIFTNTQKTLNSIFAAAQILGTHYWQRQGRVQMTKDEFAIHLKEMHKYEEIFWDHGKQEDEIASNLKAILADIERITAPAFQNESTLYEFMTKHRFRKYKA
jgi:hypothetical protein